MLVIQGQYRSNSMSKRKSSLLKVSSVEDTLCLSVEEENITVCFSQDELLLGMQYILEGDLESFPGKSEFEIGTEDKDNIYILTSEGAPIEYLYMSNKDIATIYNQYNS